MTKQPRISDGERRARLVARHHLGRTAPDVEAAVRALVAQHSSDPITPHLAAWARVPAFATKDLDAALLETKSLWRLHAMRRTLFVVPADEAPMFGAAAGRKIAEQERKRLEGWVAAAIRARSTPRWLAKLEARVLEELADGSERRTQDLSDAIPELATPVTLGSGKWSQLAPVGSRVLFVMAMEGRIVRTRPAGSWRSSQYHWASTARWFGGEMQAMAAAQANAELARRYLAAHGPATMVDVRWWTGWTAKQAATALSDAGAVAVKLDDGGEGLVLPEDVATRTKSVPNVALLPGLDSTPMGWKERDWYLGEHAEHVFDRNGNVGPTVWVNGRIVGGWAQRADGAVVHRLLEDVGKQAESRVAEEAARLGEWMDGMVAIPRFRTPLERELSGANPPPKSTAKRTTAARAKAKRTKK